MSLSNKTTRHISGGHLAKDPMSHVQLFELHSAQDVQGVMVPKFSEHSSAPSKLQEKIPSGALPKQLELNPSISKEGINAPRRIEKSSGPDMQPNIERNQEKTKSQKIAKNIEYTKDNTAYLSGISKLTIKRRSLQKTSSSPPKISPVKVSVPSDFMQMVDQDVLRPTEC